MQINQPRKSEFIKIASEDDVASKGARYACGIGVEVGLAIAARRKMCQDDLLDLGLGGNFADLLTRQMVGRSEEHTSELQSLMRISYAVFCLKKKTTIHQNIQRLNKSLKNTRVQKVQHKYNSITKTYYLSNIV